MDKKKYASLELVLDDSVLENQQSKTAQHQFGRKSKSCIQKPKEILQRIINQKSQTSLMLPQIKFKQSNSKYQTPSSFQQSIKQNQKLNAMPEHILPHQQKYQINEQVDFPNRKNRYQSNISALHLMEVQEQQFSNLINVNWDQRFWSIKNSLNGSDKKQNMISRKQSPTLGVFNNNIDLSICSTYHENTHITQTSAQKYKNDKMEENNIMKEKKVDFNIGKQMKQPTLQKRLNLATKQCFGSQRRDLTPTSDDQGWNNQKIRLKSQLDSEQPMKDVMYQFKQVLGKFHESSDFGKEILFSTGADLSLIRGQKYQQIQKSYYSPSTFKHKNEENFLFNDDNSSDFDGDARLNKIHDAKKVFKIKKPSAIIVDKTQNYSSIQVTPTTTQTSASNGNVRPNNKNYSTFMSQFNQDLVQKRQYLQTNDHKEIIQQIDEENEIENVDQNLESLIINDECYDQMEHAKEMIQFDILKNKSSVIIKEMKLKSDIQRQEQLKEIKGIRSINFMNLLFGTKEDQLVQKYITNLKRKVIEKTDNETKIQHDNMIIAIIKKLKFNKTMKNIKIEGRSVPYQDKIILLPSQIILAKDQASKSKKLGENNTQGNIKQIKIDAANIKQLFQKEFNKVKKEHYEFELFKFKTEELQHLERAMVNTEQVKDYVSISMSKGEGPLPILNRITEEGEMMLLNYKLSAGNSQSFGDSLKSLIPHKLTKLTLWDNNLNDRSISSIFKSLSSIKEGGLSTFALIQNQIGNEAIESLVDNFFDGEAAKHIKKFCIKNPLVVSKNLKMDQVFQKIQENSLNISKLTTLTISQMKLSGESMQPLGEAIKGLLNLQFLDLSATNMDGNQIHELLTIINRFNGLKSINFSFNSVRQLASVDEKSENWAVKTISNFIHFSDSLLHIDLGGMNYGQKELQFLIKNGLRKSRTLISCHLEGANTLGEKNFSEILKILNVKEKSQHDPQLDTEEYDNVLSKYKSVSDGKDIFANELLKQRNKEKNVMKKLLKEPLFKTESDKRVVFERMLGHPEILNSNRWIDSTLSKCKICNKSCYTTIIWNKQVQNDFSLRYKFYKQAASKPIIFQKNYKNKFPVCVVNKSVYKMIELDEFIDRLKKGQNSQHYKFRSCDNLVEEQRYNILKTKIMNAMEEDNTLHPTFKQQINEVLHNRQYQSQEEIERSIKNSIVPQHLNNVIKWDEIILELIPKGSFQPVDIQMYTILIKQKYEQVYPYPEEQVLEEDDIFRVDMKRLEAIRKETYLVSTYLPCKHDSGAPKTVSGLKVEIMVCHPDMDNVDLLALPVLPKFQHLSLHKMNINYKDLKKVKKIRLFVFQTSIFCNWKIDTEKNIQKAFMLDAQYLKCNKFIKDKDELNKVVQVLRKHFAFLKGQFLYLICNMKYYPVVTWMEFTHACQKWGFIDEDLTQQDVDRTFVAVNFEQVDLVQNDDNSLCRYEFLEIIVRMAKIKYQEKGNCTSISEATERLLVDEIIPHSCEYMPWQPFRDDRLWNIECDDLLKANKSEIGALFKLVKNRPGSNIQILSISDCIWLFNQVGYEGSQIEKQVTVAYVLSKMTIIDEMEEFSKYKDMVLVEFIEFLGRMAEQIIKKEQALNIKLEYILQQIFSKMLKTQLTIPDFGDIQNSDSDCSDDLVEEIKNKFL